MKKFIIFAIFFLFILLTLQAGSIEYEKQGVDSKKLKESYDYLTEKSSQNSCFKSVFEELNRNCKEILDQNKIIYALHLTKCFYEISGKQFFSCDFLKTPTQCASKLHNEDWNTYLSFYNHVDNLCFYYHGIIWQEESEKMINTLFNTASISKDLLKNNLDKTNEISKMHEKIDEDLQKHFTEVLKKNEEIRESYISLAEKTQNISSSFDDVHQKLQSHDSKLQDIFSQITTKIENIIMILNWMSMEFLDIKTFCYYFFIIFLVILITSIQRLYTSRASVFLIILGNFTMERLFFNQTMRGFFGLELMEYQFVFVDGIFALRCFFCCFILMRLTMSYYSYKDFSELTYLEVLKFAKAKRYEDSAILKLKMKSCLTEILESHMKKLIPSRPLSLKKTSFFEEIKNKTNTYVH